MSMELKSRAFRSLLTIVALTVAAGVANAASITYYGSSYGASFSPLAGTDFSASDTLQMFNPALGTLTGITITTIWDANTVLTVTNNDGAFASNGSAQTKITTSSTDAGSLLAGQRDISDYNFYFFLPNAGYSYTLAAGSSTTSGTLTRNNVSITDPYNTTIGNLTAGIAAEFTGAGTITLAFGTLTQTVLSNTGGNTNASQSTHAQFKDSITYDYTPAAPTPEPATMGLLGSALIGLGVFGKKVRRNR
jgi:hypothetical protein